MFQTLEQNAIQRIIIARKVVSANYSIATTDIQNSIGIREYSFAATVTRIYAIYENFVRQIISDYLDVLCDNRTFATLTDDFKNEYRVGISYVLGHMDHRKYSHLNHENIVSWYADCLKNKNPYKIVTEALTRHEQNLRLPTLSSIFRRVQLPNLESWLCNSPYLTNYFGSDNLSAEILENELKNFVEFRNDASHGNTDNLESEENLTHLCDFVEALIRGIGSYIRKNVFEELLPTDQIVKIGKVTEVFKKAKAVIVKMNGGTQIRRNQTIFILTNKDCFPISVKSIQYLGTELNSVRSKNDEVEVGLQFHELIPKDSLLVYTL